MTYNHLRPIKPLNCDFGELDKFSASLKELRPVSYDSATAPQLEDIEKTLATIHQMENI